MDQPTVLANTISAFATILSGVCCVAFSFLIGRQPLRWIIAYAGIFITGVPTVWFHGYGETYLAGIFDGGTNLLLAWLLQVAALWDGYPMRTRWGVAIGSGIINFGAILTKLMVGPRFNKIFPIDLGAFGGFNISEIVLILGSITAVALLYGRIREYSTKSKRLLNLSTAFFLVGTFFASAGNHTVKYDILAFHATWHVVGAFGFIVLWGFNQTRFNPTRYSLTQE